MHSCVHNTKRPNSTHTITVASLMQTIMPVMNRCLHTHVQSQVGMCSNRHTHSLLHLTHNHSLVCALHPHNSGLTPCCTSVQKCCFRALLIFLRAFWSLNTEMCMTPNTSGSHQFGEYSETQCFHFKSTTGINLKENLKWV